MRNHRSLQYLRDGIVRGLSTNYRVEQGLPNHIKLLLGRLSLLDSKASAVGRGFESSIPGVNPTPTDSTARRELDRYLDRLGAYLPDWLCRAVRWLREPDRFIARIVVSLVLLVGGLLWFLPVLGFWMLPLGLIILSQDLTFLQRPLVRAFRWTEHKFRNFRGHFEKDGGG